MSVKLRKYLLLIYIVFFSTVIIIMVHINRTLSDYKTDECTTELLIKDKRDIANSLMDDIEAIRIGRLKYESLISPNPEDDSLLRYEDVSKRLNIYTVGKNRVTSPLPTHENISIIVDYIVYSEDSLKCFALVIVEKHFPPEIRKQRYRHEYDGFGIIGLRDTIGDVFDLYPQTYLSASNFPNPTQPLQLLYKCYSTRMAGAGGASVKILKKEHTSGFRDSQFFTNDPLFMQDSLGNFGCQFVDHGLKIIPVNLYRNKRKVKMPSNSFNDKYFQIDS